MKTLFKILLTTAAINSFADQYPTTKVMIFIPYQSNPAPGTQIKGSVQQDFTNSKNKILTLSSLTGEVIYQQSRCIINWTQASVAGNQYPIKGTLYSNCSEGAVQGQLVPAYQ